MKLLFFLVALFAVASSEKKFNSFKRTFNDLHQEPPPPPMSPTHSRAAEVETLFITQKLDHSDESNEKTWQMRYLANSEHFVAGSPIFIFVGGEWEVSNSYIVGGHMYDMAKEHNGYLFYTEHRYYGKSIPTEDLSTANLKYLDIKQALRDLNHFITFVKSTIPGLENSKVILTGGSYSATMVSWFQRMFPGVAAGSWSSSAPLLAKVNFMEYKEICGQSIKKAGGEACYNRIENGIKELESMMSSKRSAEVKALFKLCNSFNPSNKLDVYAFFGEISDIFAGVVQGGNPASIKSSCDEIMSGEDDVQGLSKFVLRRTYFPAYSSCVDLSYQALIEALGDTSDTDQMMRQWFYQTCNEYGWYQTSESKAQPFGTQFPTELYTNACADAYSVNFSAENIQSNIEKTNLLFGGLNLGADNVYITHGELDPWRAMGIQEIGRATILPNYAHCKDFGSIGPSDSEEMKASKTKISELVREWVKA